MKYIQTKKIPLLIVLFVLSFYFNIAKIQAQGLNTNPDDWAEADKWTATVGEKKAIDIDGDSYDDVLVEVLSIGADGRPMIKTTSLLPSQEGGSQYVSSPFIAQYIAAMYKYAVIIISILSTIFIIFAGVQWIISGGNAERINSAKQMIARSLTGLFIALGSYTLLYTINPDLVTFRNLEVLKTSAIVEIPPDRTIPEGTPVDPPEKNLVILTTFTDNQIIFGPGVDRRATKDAKAALEAALDEYAFKYTTKNDPNSDVIISTAYRSPLSQYGLMTEQCGCRPVDEIMNPQYANRPEPVDIAAGEWSEYCYKLSECKIGYKFLAFSTSTMKFQAPNIAHFGGNAFDVSVALTGAIKPCGDIAVDNLAKKSEGVTNAGQYKGDWCIPKQQQLLIRAMRNNGFCVGIKDGSNLREPWHFEYINGGTQIDFCTGSDQDPNIDKLEYLKDIK